MNVTRMIATAGTVLVPASPAASASVDAGTAGRICAALNALAFKGDSGSDAIATAAGAYGGTQAQVVAAIGERCPQLKQIIPAGAGT